MGAPLAPTPEALEEREEEALRLRVRGKGYREIGKLNGTSHVQAIRDVRAALKRHREENADVADEARELDLKRIDRAIEVVTDILEGKPKELIDPTPLEMAEQIADSNELRLKAADRLVKLQDRRAALLGIDAPKKQELSGNLGIASLDDIKRMRESAQSNECEPPIGKEPNS